MDGSDEAGSMKGGSKGDQPMDTSEPPVEDKVSKIYVRRHDYTFLRNVEIYPKGALGQKFSESASHH